ncbi:uncharacterized protein LOC108241290 [Kryptolebias marmoratus]|uniref:uncharacterized protein LOC108241290 n=1 Tax=Kryptolebias marmoratus TaxID=37003 RepID=UPI0007F8F6FD|nr:uncharacterized protein LOC108241290 [Kryptolebias marmoratus]
MPQRSLHPLVYILLMWITIVSIIQVVFIAFFFTLGQNGQSLGYRGEKPGGTNDSLVGTTLPTTAKRGMMLNFKAQKAPTAKEAIFWVAVNPNQNVISESGKELDIKKDGYYFLSLRVTLSSCEEAGGSTPSPEHTVKLKLNLKSQGKSEEKVLLEGGIDRQTNSSGQLSRVKGLYAGGKLVVTISPQTMCLNTSEAVTHLDVIFMQKH